jgi:hypothetical protein
VYFLPQLSSHGELGLAWQCTAGGVPSILFGRYGWNKLRSDCDQGVRRAADWDEVSRVLLALPLAPPRLNAPVIK